MAKSAWVNDRCSTQLNADKRLTLREEKEELQAKLLEV